MIIKGAQVLPHALINNVDTKLGRKGEKLLEYVSWLSSRIQTMRVDPSYSPVLHIDVYGTIGAAFGNNNYKEMADYLATLEEAAKPFHLRIEGPMDCDCDRETQLEALAGLTRELDQRGINVELVADEWCNTLEDIKLFADHKAGHMVQIKTRIWAASTTPSRPCSTARRRASAPIRAAPATRPTAVPRCASTAPWPPSRCRSLPSPAWAWTRAI